MEGNLPVDLVWQNGPPGLVKAVTWVSGTDPKAANSFAQPDAVTARAVEMGRLDGNAHEIVVPPLSFTVVRYG
jgi:alpha-N-arabinofuranosidase